MKNSRVIGNIITITNNNIVAELSADIGNYVNLSDGIYFVGEIGSYVKINDINRIIIAEIVGIDEKNDISFERLSKAGRTRFLKISLVGEIINSEFKFGVTKMPPIYSELKIINENDLMLMLDVRKEEEYPEPKDGENTRLVTLPIGKSIIFPEYDVRIKLNEFFAFHFSVFGNTGAGKSNTIARMIQNIFAKENYSAKGAKFIIFDSNGEYASAFNTLHVNNKTISAKFLTTSEDDIMEDVHRFTVPVWALSIDDWAILLHATEKTQVPIIRRALELINVFDSGTDEDKQKTKNHIVATVVIDILSGADTPPSCSNKIKAILEKFPTESFSLDKTINYNKDKDKPDRSNPYCPQNGDISLASALYVHFGNMTAPASIFDYCKEFVDEEHYQRVTKNRDLVTYTLQRFLEAIEFAIIYEGSINSARIYEYTATLVTRLQHLTESEHGSFLEKTKYNNLDEYVEDIIGNNQLLNLDVSSLDDTATEVITKVFSKILFDYIRRKKPRNSTPVNLILEEAHRYVKSNMDYGVLGYNIFERIAREGRKFGILLGISSQRPSELSKTVVSQCSNFIIHRIQNPDDIRYISRMVPYISEGIIDRITYLQRGHALVFGTAVNLPTLTSFELAEPMPDSSNANITEKWYIPNNN